jgi:4-amino-4-deoxy-L-arabinose transferase-like glycosyltransferase
MNRWRTWLLGVLLVWIAVVAWWAVTPTTDTVPTGAVKNKDGALVQTTQAVQCAAPLSGTTSPKGALPVLKPASRDYQRDPCKLPHQNDRLILAVDVVLVIGVIIVLIRTWKPATEELALDGASTA